jgi:hypothetical protein
VTELLENFLYAAISQSCPGLIVFNHYQRIRFIDLARSFLIERYGVDQLDAMIRNAEASRIARAIARDRERRLGQLVTGGSPPWAHLAG